ncbi:polysaccharide deacetylase family protein [Nitrosophilus kaiyonis]|uniref:polysaccharide deacetylase family protein n=1 Tax=Nitrosophilus kaiyonis TaxID=2930200 RepID=UPI0024929066|nr:polysaccharide deacetylase family protein [Nitrosophilus kaiyonis]
MSNIVNILTFHHINPNRDILTIPPELLEKLIINLKKNYNFISYKDFIDFIFKNKNLPKKSILLTFDDGYLDNFIYAYPILKKYNIPAVIFIITGFIKDERINRNKLPYFKIHKELDRLPDKNLFLNINEIETMKESGLIDFDSHTVNHFVCKNKEYEDIYNEMINSYKFIKNIETKEYYGFCWPRGAFDDIALKAIKNSPYTFAFSTIDGAFHKGDDLYTIKRIDCSSWNGNEKDYIDRVNRKLSIYSNPLISKIYSNFREFRIKIKRKWKRK